MFLLKFQDGPTIPVHSFNAVLYFVRKARDRDMFRFTIYKDGKAIARVSNSGLKVSHKPLALYLKRHLAADNL